MATTSSTKSSTTRRAAASKTAAAKTASRKSAATKTVAAKTATVKNSADKPSGRRPAAAGNTASKPTARKPAATAPDAPATTPAAVAQDAAAGVESLVEPFQALQTLALENTGRLVALQIGAIRRYSDAVLSGCREISTIEDAEALQEFVTRQGETVGSLTAAAAEDFHAATRMGMDYVAAAGDIFGRSFNKGA